MYLQDTAIPSLNMPYSKKVDIKLAKSRQMREQRLIKRRNRKESTITKENITGDFVDENYQEISNNITIHVDSNDVQQAVIPENNLTVTEAEDEQISVQMTTIPDLDCMQITFNDTELYTVEIATEDEASPNEKSTQTVNKIPIKTVEIGMQTDSNILSSIYRRTKPIFYENLTDEYILYYTGLTRQRFDLLFYAIREETEEHKHFEKYLSKKNQLVLCLIRYKQNLDFTLISHLYGLNRHMVSDIFRLYTSILFNYFKSIDWWSLRDKDPDSYTIIIDCTETETQHSVDLPLLNQKLFSNYKNRPTIKILYGIDEKGFVIFCSDVFCGSISDQRIVQESGFLDLLQEGDSVLADRGFDIADVLAIKKVTLNIPPFKGRRQQLSEEEIMETRVIANRRIHIERVIKVAKINKILSQTIPAFLWPIINEIVYVGAFLVNFKASVV